MSVLLSLRPLLSLRQYLKASLSPDRRDRVAQFQALHFRRTQHLAHRLFFSSNLKMLAMLNNSDKWGSHWYAQHYERHFAPLRHRRLNLLEIGIGGYENPKLGGGSLRMWRTYFPRGHIFGLDIFDKSLHDERRIRTFKGSQVDEKILDEILTTIGRLDIVIDDGSHLNEHVLRTFAMLFPRLDQNGVYVIEDTQTSYWPRYGGSSEQLDTPNTTMGFFKRLVDGINHAELQTQGHDPSYYDRNITELHFYHNLIVVQKGINSEGSNIRLPHD